MDAKKVEDDQTEKTETGQPITNNTIASNKNSGAEGDKASAEGLNGQPVNLKSKAKERISKAKAKKTCVEDCHPGRKSGCPIKSKRRKEGQLSCVEVHDLLRSIGIEKPEEASKCVKAAIMKGFIKLTGDKKDLDMIIFRDKGICGHMIDAKLGDLINQKDYGGDDYEEMEYAPVICQVEGCDTEEERLGRTYVSGICNGRPNFDCGKFHNHCTDCSGFGTCVYDYRNAHCDGCGGHPYQDRWSDRFECYKCDRKAGRRSQPVGDDCNLM